MLSRISFGSLLLSLHAHQLFLAFPSSPPIVFLRQAHDLSLVRLFLSRYGLSPKTFRNCRERNRARRSRDRDDHHGLVFSLAVAVETFESHPGRTANEILPATIRTIISSGWLLLFARIFSMLEHVTVHHISSAR